MSVLYTCLLAVYGVILSANGSFKESKAVFLSCLFTIFIFGASFSHDYSWFGDPIFRYITLQTCGLIAVCSLSCYVIWEVFLDKDQGRLEAITYGTNPDSPGPGGPDDPTPLLTPKSSEGKKEEPFYAKLIWGKDLKILEPIGKGHFGKVYKALYHRRNGTAVEVVCKVKVSGPPCALEWRELQTLHYLLKKINEYGQNSEYVLRLFGECTDFEDGTPGKIALVCAYHPGGNLLTEAESGQSHGKGFGHVVSTAYGMAMAVKYLHTHNILHRDIKLDNFVRSDAGSVVIIDFGLARRCDKNGVYDSKEDSIWPNDLPPERQQHPETSTKACDIYTLGKAFRELKAYYKYEDDFDNFDFHKKFLKIIELCLSDHPKNRPGIDRLVLWLKDLKRRLLLGEDLEESSPQQHADSNVPPVTQMCVNIRPERTASEQKSCVSTPRSTDLDSPFDEDLPDLLKMV